MENPAFSITSHERDKRKAKIVAAIFSVILFFFILYPFWSYPFPPPGQEGILVAFGEVEFGGSDSNSDSQNEEAVSDPDDAENPEKQSEVFQENAKPSKPENNSPTINTKSATQEKSEVVLKDKKSKQSNTAEAVKQPTEQEIAELQEAEEARKKAEYEKAKKQFGDLLGQGKGGTTAKGNAGDPAGDPSADVLSGISKGKGNIGGGLADRGVLYEPEIDENSQKSGKVVIRVCVNDRGEVVEAKYTQLGSTTTDTDLVNAAIAGSKRYKFSKSPIERQCGTITIEFKLK